MLSKNKMSNNQHKNKRSNPELQYKIELNCDCDSYCSDKIKSLKYETISVGGTDLDYELYQQKKYEESREVISNVSDFYALSFPNGKKSKPSGNPKSFFNSSERYNIKPVSVKTKPIEYYKEQYKLYKRNYLIKKKISSFHYDILISQICLENNKKPKLNFFTKTKWTINKYLYHFVKKYNLFPTDLPDMHIAIRYGIEGRLTGDVGFTTNETNTEKMSN